MKREDFFKETVKPIEIKPRSISELLEAMAETSFQGRKLSEVYRVWKSMLSDNDVTILMGLAGSMSTAGMWKIVGQLIDDNFLDVLPLYWCKHIPPTYMLEWDFHTVRVARWWTMSCF
jgi:Deoxyhypusine synthase